MLLVWLGLMSVALFILISLLFKSYTSQRAVKRQTPLINKETVISTKDEPETPTDFPFVQANKDGGEPQEIINKTCEISWNQWHNPPDGTIILKGIKVSGTTYNNDDGVNRQKILAHLKKNETATLVREPSNTFDKNAVLVMIAMGAIGYIEKKSAPMIAAFLDNGFKYVARANPVGSVETTFGSRVRVHFTPNCTFKTITTKIVGINGKNENEEKRKDILDIISKLDHVWVDEPFVTHGDQLACVYHEDFSGDFGRLPKKAARQYIEMAESGYEFQAYISDKYFDEIEITIYCFGK